MSCILGGYLADNVLGRYKTILYFSLLYVAGMGACPCISLREVDACVLACDLFAWASNTTSVQWHFVLVACSGLQV